MNQVQKNVIIQCSPINSASVILSNILYGLISENDPVKYIENESINEIKDYINKVEIPIIKTHICGIDLWIDLIKGYNLIFICSENDTDKIKNNYRNLKNLVIIDYKLLIKTKSNTIEKIVDLIHSDCIKILPNSITLNKETAINRINTMYAVYETIKNKPFSYYDPIYHIHGSHEQVEKISYLSTINSTGQRVLIVSPGGCACTSIIKFLKPYVKRINCANDTDKLKHTLPSSNLIKKYNATHIIYVFGDIVKALRSLFRRNFSHEHYYKLRNIILNSVKCPYINYNSYIDLTIDKNYEPMGILNHFKEWKDVPNVFFINYESINTSKKFNDYLGLPGNVHKNFLIKDRKAIPNILESPKYLSIINRITELMMEKNNTCNPPCAT